MRPSREWAALTGLVLAAALGFARPSSARAGAFEAATGAGAITGAGSFETGEGSVPMLAAAPDSVPSEPAAADSVSPAPKPGPAWKRIPHDTRHALHTFGSDAWYIVSAPARLDRRRSLVVLGVIGASAIVYNNDEAIIEAARRNRDAPVYRQVVDIGETFEPLGFMGKTNPFYIGGILAGYAFDVRLLRVIPAEILESHMIAGGIRNVAKTLLGRRRPFENRGPYFFEFNGGTSFPSGHASVVFELATIFSHHAHRWPVTVACYGIATCVAIQRFESRNHWPSDVFIPAVTGTLIARTIVRRHEEKSSFSLAPEISSHGIPMIRLSCGF